MSKLADELRGIKSRTADPVLGSLTTFGHTEGTRERAADALDAAEKALREIANINLGPDKASGEWRCTEVEAIARAALARLEGK
jgi:hypothetical protein